MTAAGAQMLSFGKEQSIALKNWEWGVRERFWNNTMALPVVQVHRAASPASTSTRGILPGDTMSPLSNNRIVQVSHAILSFPVAMLKEYNEAGETELVIYFN